MATDKPTDDLYRQHPPDRDFTFNETVARVFDDMLDRSVPCYAEVIDHCARLLECFIAPGDTIYDLGCSTGTTLLQLSRLLAGHSLHYIGIDSSSAMIKKARSKAAMFSKSDRIRFQRDDITTIRFSNAGAILCNYTLQFVRPMIRQEFVRGLFSSLRDGGILLLSEKIICPHPRLNREFIGMHHRFKRERGYSELEIANKREALENVLIPFTVRENKKLLRQAGFSGVETFFQWFNFVSFVAVKE